MGLAVVSVSTAILKFWIALKEGIVTESALAALGFVLTEHFTRTTHLHEARKNLYSSSRELIASFSASIRTSDGEQVLNTSSQFVQRNTLSREQIDAVTDWLRECSISARWRLTTYTVPVN